MKTIRFTFVVALTIYASLAFAIRIINNGGGYAEMKTLSALARLENIATACRLASNACDLTARDLEILDFLKQKRFLDTKTATLEFFTDTTSPDWVRYKPGQPNYFSLSSPSLYDGGRPKSFAELAIKAFLGWINRDEVRLTLRAEGYMEFELDRLAEKILNRAMLNENNIYLDNREGILHEVTIKHTRSQWTSALLAVEVPTETIDLTPKLLGQVPCSNSAIAAILRTERVYFQDPFVIGQIHWRCGEEYFKGRFTVELPQVLNRESLTERAPAKIFSVSREIAPFCRSSIEGN